MDSFAKRVLSAQAELKAPKNQFNKFGGYKYRSCEDILEAAKPICLKYSILLTVDDEIVLIGDRYYVKATATVSDTESQSEISKTAFARESKEKKGMDDSQITGTASSYARKYALNGLFCIDDTNDADTDETKTESDNRSKPKSTGTWGALPSAAVICEKCGRPVEDFTTSKGTVVKADYIASQSFRQYGKHLCMECSQAAKNEVPKQ